MPGSSGPDLSKRRAGLLTYQLPPRDVIAQAKGQWAEYFEHRLKSEHKA